LSSHFSGLIGFVKGLDILVSDSFWVFFTLTLTLYLIKVTNSNNIDKKKVSNGQRPFYPMRAMKRPMLTSRGKTINYPQSSSQAILHAPHMQHKDRLKEG
jgi:hypothetical protein